MRIVFVCTALLLGGCVSQSTMLRNSSGQTTYCKAEGWGYIGAPVAAHMHSECIKKAHANGFYEADQPIPSAIDGSGIAQSAAQRILQGAGQAPH